MASIAFQFGLISVVNWELEDLQPSFSFMLLKPSWKPIAKQFEANWIQYPNLSQLFKFIQRHNKEPLSEL